VSGEVWFDDQYGVFYHFPKVAKNIATDPFGAEFGYEMAASA
jgi:hypothetical protein